MPVEHATLRALCSALSGEVTGQPDWEAVVALANRSNTTPILAQRLHGHPALPDDLRTFLSEVRQRLQRRNAMLADQLAEAVEVLNGIGLRPVLLKGSALLAMQGAEHCTRLSVDNDLMVPAEAMLDALAALQGIGYRHTGNYFTPHNALNLVRDSDAGALDLHARIKLPRPVLDYAAMLEGSQKVAVGDAVAALPSATKIAGQLLLHDLLQEHDYWRGLIDLRHLIDVRELAAGPDPLDWDTLFAWFPPGHTRRALETQLLTSAALFGAGLPVPDHPAWRARLQVRRRLYQLSHPRRRALLTALSVLADPPWYPRALRRFRLPGPAEGWTSFIDRQFLSPRFGKL